RDFQVTEEIFEEEETLLSRKLSTAFFIGDFSILHESFSDIILHSSDPQAEYQRSIQKYKTLFRYLPNEKYEAEIDRRLTNRDWKFLFKFFYLKNKMDALEEEMLDCF